MSTLSTIFYRVPSPEGTTSCQQIDNEFAAGSVAVVRKRQEQQTDADLEFKNIRSNFSLPRVRHSLRLHENILALRRKSVGGT